MLPIRATFVNVRIPMRGVFAPNFENERTFGTATQCWYDDNCGPAILMNV